VNRGEIWWASLGEPYGSEPGYRRPVLIIQADEFNSSNINTIICAVITTNLKLGNAPGNVQLSMRSSGLTKLSVINISQLITIDKKRLTGLVKRLDNQTMNKVDDGLRLVMKL
jgi:mRNA interferase MazF